MIKTFTVSAEQELHSDYKRLCIDRGTNVSKALQEFMQSELDGKQKAFEQLEKRVDDLETLINTKPKAEIKNQNGF
jgi:hypothetical protein